MANTLKSVAVIKAMKKKKMGKNNSIPATPVQAEWVQIIILQQRPDELSPWW